MLECSSGESLVLLASATAIAISKELSNDDINTLANFFNALGDNLAIISTQQENCGK